MAGIDLGARGLRREAPAPDGERRLGIGAGAAREVELGHDDEDRAGDGAAGGEVGLVLAQIDGRAGAIVLAEGVDARGLVAALPVGRAVIAELSTTISRNDLRRCSR